MSSIHYFQRYSQKENVVTNNALLLFSRLYNHSPNKFNVFLSSILADEEVEPGIQFIQQLKGKISVPDGLIYQKSFKIVIETKLYGAGFTTQQIENHIQEQLSKNQHQNAPEPITMLLLSPDKADKSIEQSLNGKFENATILCLTFEQIVKSFKESITEYDFELQEIIQDYESCCREDGLITDKPYNMRVVTTGKSFDINTSLSIYSHPSDRGYQPHSFIGLYRDKAVRAIGKIDNTIEAEIAEAGELKILSSTSTVTEKQKENILKAIQVSFDVNKWEMKKGHVFFSVEKFYKTDFVKTSPFPLRGTRYFNLHDLGITNLADAGQIADQLGNVQKTW